MEVGCSNRTRGKRLLEFIFVCCSLGPGIGQQYVNSASLQKFKKISGEDVTISKGTGLRNTVEFHFFDKNYYF
jgi:hypothetical protein